MQHQEVYCILAGFVFCFAQVLASRHTDGDFIK